LRLQGVLLCLTIIGIPLDVGCFKMAGAALMPLGRQIVKLEEFVEPPPDASTRDQHRQL
jgi:uncharacterized membrane protein YccF (DUF307 family)